MKKMFKICPFAKKCKEEICPHIEAHISTNIITHCGGSCSTAQEKGWVLWAGAYFNCIPATEEDIIEARIRENL